MNEQEKKAISGIFPEPVARKIVQIVTSNKPAGWGKRSTATYYKQFYAEAIKEDIDKMIASGETMWYKYAAWCADGLMSKGTLYLRINHSIRYLLEEMDPNGYYKQWFERIKIERLREGIKISFIKGMGTNKLHAEFTPDSDEPEAKIPQWKTMLTRWLEDDNDSRPFVRENLMLTPSEIAELKEQLCQLNHLMISISSSSIRIIKSK